MRAGAELFADGKEKHSQQEQRHIFGQAECDKTGDIGAERQDHHTAASGQIGGGSRGYLEQVDGDFAETDEQADGEKTQTLFEKDQYEKGFEVALVF